MFFVLKQSPTGDLAMQKARKNPDRYVIKPQREGGGKYIVFSHFFFISTITITKIYIAPKLE